MIADIWDDDGFGEVRPDPFVSPLDSEEYVSPIYPNRIRYAWAVPESVFGQELGEDHWAVYFFGVPDPLAPLDSSVWNLDPLLDRGIIYLGVRTWKDSLRSHIAKKRMWRILDVRDGQGTYFVPMKNFFHHLGRVPLQKQEYQKTEFWKMVEKTAGGSGSSTYDG